MYRFSLTKKGKSAIPMAGNSAEILDNIAKPKNIPAGIKYLSASTQ